MASIPDIINTAYATARSGRAQQAVEDLRRSLRVHTDDPDLHEHLGLILMQLGQTDQSMYHLQRATHFAPKRADFFCNFATSLNMQGKSKEAAAEYKKAIVADPNSFQGHLGLSSAEYGLGDDDAAIATATRAVELNPRAPEAAINLGLALIRSGRGGEGLKVFRDGLDRAGEHPMLLMNLAMASLLRPEASARDVFNAHARLGRAIAATSGAGQPLFPDMRPDRKLRVGYVAPDFPDRAVARFIKPILAAHDRDQFDIICYSGRPEQEADTAGLSSLCTWVETRTMYDPALEQRIRADRIDILVALCSHHPMGRLPLFARRPAPVQIAYLGAPGTTGIKAIGSTFGDAATDPEGSLTVEKLIRLDRCAFAYAPPEHAPKIAARPADAPVTFACFGSSRKINEQVLDAWAAILKAVPNSRLLLKEHAYELAATRRNLTQSLTSRGIDESRFDIETASPGYDDHLAAFNNADIALDTFPYNSRAIACEALWMGLPVISLAGDRHASRMTLSILTALGMPELAPATTDGYISAAVALAEDSHRRGQLRQSLRDRMQSSPLCDGKSLTQALETHYRAMWKEWTGSVYYAGAADPVQFVAPPTPPAEPAPAQPAT